MARTTLTRFVRLVVSLLLVLPAGSTHLAAQYDVPGAPRAGAPLTILQINDVYSTVPIDGVGGLARVATVKQQVAAQGGHPLLMIAGDFLSTSVASTVFKGEQMVATLNAAGLDLATLGNHEFDFGLDVLLERMAESRWTWVISNVLDRRTGKPIGNADPYVIRTFGSMKVGVIGLCLTSDVITRDTLERIELVDPFDAAAAYLPMLQKENVDVIVALTHLSFADDRALAERFPAIDVIVGGHEHFPITTTIGKTLISKAGTEARYVARIDVDRKSGSPVERYFELLPITAAIPDEPRTAAVANAYEAKLDAALNSPIGRSTTELDGRASRLRTSETNLGDVVADAMRESVGADIAIVNAGGIRSDRLHPPGMILRRTTLEIHPFGNVVCKISVAGRVVTAALEHGVAGLPAVSGGFPQVSGLTFRVNPRAPVGARISNVRVQGTPIDPDRLYTLALPNFVLLGGDGYDMFRDQKIEVGPEEGPLIAVALERYLSKETISPQIQGRIVVTSEP